MHWRARRLKDQHVPPDHARLTVLELLQTHKRISGPELARRLKVDVRTTRHYITLLHDLGIPIDVQRGRYGAYQLRPGFKLPPLMFSEGEAVVIFSAAAQQCRRVRFSYCSWSNQATERTNSRGA